MNRNISFILAGLHQHSELLSHLFEPARGCVQQLIECRSLAQWIAALEVMMDPAQYWFL